MPFYDQGRKVEIVCLQCGKPFSIYVSRQDKAKYCSRECHGASKRVMRHVLPCASCGKSIELSDNQIGRSAKYCSPSCVAKGNVGRFVTRVTLKCQRCGSPFTANPARVKRGGAKFCSTKCSNSREAKVILPRLGKVWDGSIRPGIVYLVTNLVNGKRYIGTTSASLRERWMSHIAVARRGGGALLAKAIRKHGAENFEIFKVIRVASMDEAFLKERELIAELHPEYNLSAGGEGNLGYRYTKEQLAYRSVMPSPLLGRRRGPNKEWLPKETING